MNEFLFHQLCEFHEFPEFFSKFLVSFYRFYEPSKLDEFSTYENISLIKHFISNFYVYYNW